MFVIRDLLNGGWACYNGIEGWHFTVVENYATKFKTRAEALTVLQEHYPRDLRKHGTRRLSIQRAE